MAVRLSFDTAEEFEDWLDSVAGDRLSRRLAFEGGNLAALYDTVADALDDVDEGDDPDQLVGLKIPRWAAAALRDVALTHLLSTLGTSPQKRRLWAKQYERDLIDWERFRQVYYRRTARRGWMPDSPKPKQARRRRDEVRAVANQRAAERGEEPRYTIDPATPYPWIATSNDTNVFKAVSEIYEGSAYKGSEYEIKKSWERVLAALQHGESWRYYPSKWLAYPGHARDAEADRTAIKKPFPKHATNQE